MSDHGYKALAKDTKQNKGMINRIRTAIIDIITTISITGRTVNTKTFSNSELRDSLVMLPYGISSSGLDGMIVQVLSCENNKTTVVGVYDNNRPNVEPGEVVIYTKFGQHIKLLKDGNIILSCINGSSIQLTNNSILFSNGTNTITIDDIINHITNV